MKPTSSMFAITALAGALVLTPNAQADQSGPPAARASGESAGASVEAAATLGSGAIVVAPSSAVLIAGSGATLVTGDPYFIEESASLAEDMLEMTFDSKPLEVSDETILAPAPNVPFEAQNDENR